MTSLLTPDENQLRLFNAFPDWGSVVEEVDVKTHRLDDLDIDEFDLLKIDVQGAELMVFQNGRERLRDAVAVHTDVSFVPLYVGQPTFGEVDVELRSQGFVPHSMPALLMRLLEALKAIIEQTNRPPPGPRTDGRSDDDPARQPPVGA